MIKKNVLLTALAIAGFAVTSLAQTVPNYVPSNGLVGWWPFNGNANDESGNGKHGIVYGAKLNFAPVIGQTYYLYEKKDDSHFLSLVGPKEWGGSGPFKKAVASVKLLADHTWMEIV